MAGNNLHGTAILLGDRGVLLTGGSGAGKTTLALALIERASRYGLFSRLVADDQVFAAVHAGRLVCCAPASIAGLVEVPGIGPQPVPSAAASVIDLCVRLVPRDAVDRFQEDGVETIAGCAVPKLKLAERNVAGAVPAIAARLGHAPFG